MINKLFKGVLLFLLLGIVLSEPIQAQVTQPDPIVIPTEKVNLPATTENWNGLYLKLRMSEKWFWYQENHYRRRNSVNNNWDFVGRMSQLYNRFGFTYMFTDNFEVTFGPTLVWQFSPDRGNPEFVDSVFDTRFWHQWLMTQSIGPVKVLHQFRFEHRFQRGNDLGSEYQYRDRWRYKITGYIPLNKPRMENNTFFIAPSNEFFFQSNRQTWNPFEENRVYTAVGYTYNNYMFFGGHMWTYGPTITPGTYRNRHIIRLNVMYTIDFRERRRPLTRDFAF